MQPLGQTIPLESLVYTDGDRVIQWRLDELTRAGYEDDVALVMAMDCDVDLHVAVDLLHRGCPPELALRILF